MCGNGLLATSTTGVSASSAFDIVIVNASGCFLHTRLQLPEPVTDTKSIIPVRIFVRTSRHKVLPFSMTVVRSVFLHKIVTIDIQ